MQNIKLSIICAVALCFYVDVYSSQDEQQKISSHYIFAVVKAKEGQESNLRSALQKAQQLSRQESTCLQYEVIKNNDNAGEFALYEQWTSKEDHALQYQKPYIIEFIEQLPTLGEVSTYIGGHNIQK